jgi:AbrB family looped-hinge helix DNA binding protein
MATTLTQKGQVTIPKHLRDQLGLKPGDKLSFELNRDGRIEITREEAALEARRAEIERKLHALRGTIDLGGMDSVDYIRWLRGDDGDDA